MTTPVTAVFQIRSRQEEAWSLEAMNACVTDGWKRLEVIGGFEKAFEENNAKFDRLVEPRRGPTRSMTFSSRQ